MGGDIINALLERVTLWFKGIFSDSFMREAQTMVVHVLAYAVVFCALWFTLPYVYPFVIALLIALLLQTPLKLLTNKLRFKRSPAAILLVVLFFVVVYGLLGLVVTMIIQESTQLYKTLSSMTFIEFRERFLDIFERIEYFTGTIDNEWLLSMSDRAVEWLSGGAVSLTFLMGTAMRLISGVPLWLFVAIVLVVSSFMLTRDLEKMGGAVAAAFTADMMNTIRSTWAEAIRIFLKTLRAYAILILTTWVQAISLFLVMRVPYAFVLSIILSFADFLPAFGPGLILIPMSLYNFISGHILEGVVFLAGYLIITAVRYVLEPKLISQTVGVPPLLPLMAVFIGLSTANIGLFLFLMLMIYTIKLLRTVRAIRLKEEQEQSSSLSEDTAED